MNFFNSLFRRSAPTPPLAPLQDPVLGALTWDQDCECWVADIPGKPAPATLYIGAGSENEHPSEPLLALMREPFRSFDELARLAFAYLEKNATLNVWNVDPRQLILTGIQTFEHYLKDRRYSVTFSAPDESIWKVHFCNGSPTA